jgi:hypothetical protein
VSEAPAADAGQLDAQLRAFAAHLRDPGAHPAPPGIEDRRLKVYRELVFNNLRELLSGNFPVIRRTLGTSAWEALVRGFLAQHRARTPLFPELAQEFLAFLEQRAASGAADPPWLRELAHYEWVELALQLADAPMPAHDPHGDLLEGAPVVAPLAWPLAYAWPVQRIGPGQVPDTPPPALTLLLVRRDARGAIHFSAISPLVYRLLELLDADGATTGRAALAQLAQEAGAGDTDAFMHEGHAMLRRLREEGTLLGTR